ncbi:MAG: hypothetical protein KAI66_16690, partial [Lentisphaeria bacterium]|nr:hypothetical protein [Lentisphaeria bacterium]
ITAVLIAFTRPIFGVLPSVLNSFLLTRLGMDLPGISCTGPDPISFQWIAPGALIVGVAVGLPVCWFTAKKGGGGVVSTSSGEPPAQSDPPPPLLG